MTPLSPPEERAALLMTHMTTAEKLAQLTGVMAIWGREERIGDFLKNSISHICTLDFCSHETYEQAVAWQRRLQEIVIKNWAGSSGPFWIIGTAVF